MVYLNATTSPTNALQTINNLTYINGIPLLSVSILIFIWFIIYIRTPTRDVKSNVAAATFFTTIIAIAFRFLGLLPDQTLSFTIAIGLLSLIPLFNR